MPSFDAVSEVDLHQLTNAVDQAGRIVANRFDFKGVDASFEREERAVTVTAEAEFQGVTEAFNILSNPERRRQHDLELSGSGAGLGG